MNERLSTTFEEEIDLDAEQAFNNCYLEGTDPFSVEYEYDGDVYRIPLPSVDIPEEAQIRRGAQQARLLEAHRPTVAKTLDRFQKLDAVFAREMKSGKFEDIWNALCGLIEQHGAFIVAESLSALTNLETRLMTEVPTLKSVQQPGEVYVYKDGTERKILKTVLSADRISILTE